MARPTWRHVLPPFDEPLQLGRLLCLSTIPLYTVSELAEKVRLFIEYLNADQAHLVRTGLPRHVFWASPWLYRLLEPIPKLGQGANNGIARVAHDGGG